MKFYAIPALLALLFTANTFAATGLVTKFSPSKGFGFIQPIQGGDEIFFHLFDVKWLSKEKIVAGYCVNYNIKYNRNDKPQAVDVDITEYCD